MAQTKQFSLLLLYDKVAASLPVAQALKEKEIDVHVVQSAAELIQHIATKKVDIVALSANHTSCTSLIRVLKEKTKVQIMVFGEDKHPSTIKKIDKAEVDLKISGIANGYNIFMKIGHMVKLKNKETEDARSIMLSGGGEHVGGKKKKQAFIVKGKEKTKKQKDSEKPISVFEKQESEADDRHEEETLAQKYESEHHEAEEETQEERTSKREAAEKGKNTISVVDDGVKEGGEETFQDDVVTKKTGRGIFLSKKENSKNKGGVVNKNGSALGAGKVQTKDTGPRPLGVGGTIVFSDEAKAAQKKKQQEMALEEEDIGGVTTQQGPEEKPSNVIDFGAHKKKKEIQERAPEQEESLEKKYEKLRAEKKSAKKSEPIAPMVKLKHKKMFKDAVLKAGEGSFEKNRPGSLGTVNKVSVVPVDNPKEKGFLLFCSNENSFLSEEDIGRFKNLLNQEMKNDSAIDFELGETFNIESFDIDICNWAEQYSQFYYHFESETGQQVVVCFLKRESVYPEFKKVDEPNGVYRVHIHTMPPEMAVGFDVFLYFMKNKRLIPYLKKGGRFTAKQIQRLYKRGFKFVYITEEQKGEFLSFYISLSINSDFQSGRKAA